MGAEASDSVTSPGRAVARPSASRAATTTSGSAAPDVTEDFPNLTLPPGSRKKAGMARRAGARVAPEALIWLHYGQNEVRDPPCAGGRRGPPVPEGEPQGCGAS